jgi:L-alanine-DL-glutamate epimerase-like enolase superfamily enzyme
MAAHVARGVRGVKMKVGGAHGVDEDLRRARAVREAIGPEVALMVDANMGWGVHEAVRAGRALVAPDIDALWLEEPTLPEDLDGMARVRALGGGVGLAMGENLHTLYEFGAALRRGVVDFPQPDASNIGGVTGWMKVAVLAQAHNLPCCSHGMQELHVSLVSAVPNGGWMEIHSFPIDEYTTRPLVLDEAGRAVAPDEPGTGVVFDMAKLEPHRVPL